MKETDFLLDEEKELLVSCNCKSEVLSLVRYDNEDEVYLTVYKYYSVSNSFSFGCSSFSFSFISFSIILK